MLPFSEACERNKIAILEVLKVALAEPRNVLEIGSGTGQHAVYFAAQLPHLAWHPTEQLQYLPDLRDRIAAQGGANVREATVLEVSQPVWPLRRVEAVFTANTLHIMSWAEVVLMLRGIAQVLSYGGVLCVYGPFRYAGAYTSDSNAQFDRMLRERDPLSGLRDVGELLPLAAALGLRLVSDHDLPANNRLLEFIRE